ncbi:tyrosine-protein phosphatase non-receptor type substrate 1-like [Lacerta agilis]|uniref:tyrosine-protein phosphatase non-receptor type substrate 1-like n=1 Tax=Lacerta agilis TaxID=80427 RepID=UPI00141A6733|nr:tyrosine-protein phosphatase non-receptor type substrate 1-like [Lacerta agilis]XP_033009701.1 tyrosine-protein phosphatase non-receptor type substrate 1-like [Lacerta agilis]XP_033009702.1 tyrosine-protein phosphatase non-receptor type substrate 1-like [Lacerta agilis]
MTMDAPGLSSRGLLTCLLPPLLLFCSWSGAKGQDLEVLQPSGPLSVSAGETLTLTCTVNGVGPPGGVKWHKGSDRKQPPIYSERGTPISRVTRVAPGSQTDFSIRISNIRPEDAGTYYCVKYRAATQDTEFKSGVGTEVSVIATPSPPSIKGPASRVLSGTSATFSCTSDGFSPRAIKVTWLKDNTRITSPGPTILPEGDSISYQLLSTVQVPLTRDDVKSQLTCQIEHETLRSPLREFFQLGDILRVPPRVKLEANPANPVLLNESVTFSCSAEGFYPEDTTLALTLNSSLSETGTAEPMAQNGDGTFTLRSSLKLNATEDRNQSAFTCLVTQNSQPVAAETSVLNIRVPTEGSESVSMEPDEKKIYIISAVVCALLVVLVVAIIYFIQARHNKDKEPTSVRLHESEKASGGANQEPDPNNVTYADLNFEKASKKSPQQVVEISQQSEYASIQTVPPAANDENVTYADLDMVHLSKAPKRPAPQPEEASSEYASVQVRGK